MAPAQAAPRTTLSIDPKTTAVFQFDLTGNGYPIEPSVYVTGTDRCPAPAPATCNETFTLTQDGVTYGLIVAHSGAGIVDCAGGHQASSRAGVVGGLPGLHPERALATWTVLSTAGVDNVVATASRQVTIPGG